MDACGAEGVRKAYGDTVALRDVSLSVRQGEVLALVGPNGAGKTTLVRCLSGTTTPDGGTVSLLGGAPGAVDRSRIGLLPQEFRPPDRLSARELVAYYAGLYDDSRDVDAVLRDVGVADTAGTRYADLSGGQRRRVCVGTALVNEPEVLFLDEPTTGIDPAGRRTVWGLVEGLAASGTTVLLTTHSMEEAERLADRVGVLVDGDLVARGTPRELVEAHGGTSRLLVETDDAVAVDGYDAERTDRGVVIEGVEPAEIGDVVAALDAAGVAYDGLVWREPDLETVYLALADEMPREPSAAGGGS